LSDPGSGKRGVGNVGDINFLGHIFGGSPGEKIGFLADKDDTGNRGSTLEGQYREELEYVFYS
jgi:hypothetical protein